MHINAIGSNDAKKSELDVEAVASCNLVVVDSKSQGEKEAGDLLPAIGGGQLSWDQVYELGEVVNGRAGRNSEREVTLFKSQGIAVEDVAVGAWVYRCLLKMTA
jgi:alanine dehydrogenase